MRASDYIFKRLKEKYGVERVFMITGGGAMHLNDAICQSGLSYTCNHHEQACAIAAEGYSRAGKRLGVVNITTGPGGLNTLTGVMGQWTDSVPVLYISGQVKQSTTISACPDIQLRQLGDQEVDIISVVKSLTKYAVQIKDVRDTKKILDQAVYMALSGRPGPVWIDVPMDIQGALINELELEDFKPGISLKEACSLKPSVESIQVLFDLLDKAQRPVLIAGNGIKIANAEKELAVLLNKFKIPAVGTFNGMDLLCEDNPYFTGRIGTLGSRGGNFTLQNADLVISVGSRNNIRQVSYNYEFFARGGKLVTVDIDQAELDKPTLKPFLKIHSDAKTFIEALCAYKPKKSYEQWLKWARERHEKYPVVLAQRKESANNVDPYYFIDRLSTLLPENALVVGGNGTACVAGFQAAKVKTGQRYIWNSGCAAMGYDLPAAIGAAQACKTNMVVCISGDGSLMMNLQELSTVIANKINLKLIVLNNNGYISIKQTQNNFFEGRSIGTDPNSGVCFPDFMALAKAFGFETMRIESNADIEEGVKIICSINKPILCEVVLSDNYMFEPKTSSQRKPDGRMVSKPLEDLYPFLSREEFLNNMIIEPLNE